MRRLLGLAAIALAALLVAGSSFGAKPPKRAVDVALQALGAKKARAVVVYGSAAPLAAGTVVSDSGPRKLARAGNATVAGWKLRRAAWLFWADLDPGADFSHPSRLVLVDARSLRVVAKASLEWEPLVNGKHFVRRQLDPRLVVFRKDARPAKARRLAAPLRDALPPAPTRASRFDREQDCMVTAADFQDDRKPSNFGDDVRELEVWASTNQAPFPHESVDSAGAFAGRVDDRVAKGCNDVVLLLAGHGLAAPGATWQGMEVGTSAEPTVILSQTPVRDARGRPVIRNGQPVVRVTTITASDIRRVIEAHKGKAHFKLVVDSCFSGRFAEALSDLQDGADPPLREIVTSSAGDEPSVRVYPGDEAGDDGRPGYFMSSLVKALKKVQSDPQLRETANGDLATEFELAAELVKEHPDVYGNLAVELGDNHPESSFAGPATARTLTLQPLQAVFDPSNLATNYTATATSTASEDIDYVWLLDLHVLAEDSGLGAPGVAGSKAAFDPTCNDARQAGGALFDQTASNATYIWRNLSSRFVWFHGDVGAYPGSDYGCRHQAMGPHGHQGVVTVVATDGQWTCSATIDGSNLSTQAESGGAATCLAGKHLPE